MMISDRSINLLLYKKNNNTHLLRNSPKKEPNNRNRKSKKTSRYRACPTMDSQHCGEHSQQLPQQNEAETNKYGNKGETYRKLLGHHMHPIIT